MTLNETQVSTMLSLQDRMNCKVNPQWLTAGYRWHQAILVEGTEALEHHGWKWWKKQPLNMAQLRMEMVDIWHFILSHQMVTFGMAGAAKQIMAALQRLTDETTFATVVLFDGNTYTLASMTMDERIELMCGLATSKRVDIALFSALLDDCSMVWSELYRQYIGKNVLNMFRQDHGYKNGTYIKVWQGREDNEVLVDLLNIVDSTHPSYQDQLYEALRDQYERVKQASSQPV